MPQLEESQWQWRGRGRLRGQWRLQPVGVVVVVAVAMVCMMVQCCAGVMVPMSDDVMGLMSFKAGLKDPTGALHSWREDDASPCAWAGVTCDHVTGRSAVDSLLRS